MPSPQDVANRITANLARLSDQLDDLQEDVTAFLWNRERGIVHVRTGRLRNSLTPYGPYRAGPLRISGIRPVGVRYDVIEHERGHDHAFAARTVEENRAAIEQWRQRAERLAVQAVES